MTPQYNWKYRLNVVRDTIMLFYRKCCKTNVQKVETFVRCYFTGNELISFYKISLLQVRPIQYIPHLLFFQTVLSYNSLFILEPKEKWTNEYFRQVEDWTMQRWPLLHLSTIVFRTKIFLQEACLPEAPRGHLARHPFRDTWPISLSFFDEQDEKSNFNDRKKELHLNAREELWSPVITWYAGNMDESISIAMYRSEDRNHCLSAFID